MKYESKLLRNFSTRPAGKFVVWLKVLLFIVLLVQTCSVRSDPPPQHSNKPTANLQQNYSILNKVF